MSLRLEHPLLILHTHHHRVPYPTMSIKIQDAAASPKPEAPSAAAEEFYTESLRELASLGVPYLVSGTYALSVYTGISRPTKDLDFVCKAGDFPRILSHFQHRGYQIEIEDERWLGKVRKGELFFDIIFASFNGVMPVSDAWFDHARQTEILGITTQIIAPTELICSKAFIQLRHRFDGADIMHLILKQHDQIDWGRLLTSMGPNWEVLLAHLINFRWIYPAERANVPRWVIDELLERLRLQLDLPPSRMKVCRGRMFSRPDYEVDVKEWGFADVAGEGDWRDE